MELPIYQLKTRENEDRKEIWCQVRKRFFLFTPEEFVRQALIRFLVENRGFPTALISVEKTIIVNAMRKRYDLLMYNRDGQHVLMAECKAPNVSIDENTLHQIANYNREVDVDHLILTNGASLYFLSRESGKNFKRIENVPTWSELTAEP